MTAVKDRGRHISTVFTFFCLIPHIEHAPDRYEHMVTTVASIYRHQIPLVNPDCVCGSSCEGVGVNDSWIMEIILLAAGWHSLSFELAMRVSCVTSRKTIISSFTPLPPLFLPASLWVYGLFLRPPYRLRGAVKKKTLQSLLFFFLELFCLFPPCVRRRWVLRWFSATDHTETPRCPKVYYGYQQLITIWSRGACCSWKKKKDLNNWYGYEAKAEPELNSSPPMTTRANVTMELEAERPRVDILMSFLCFWAGFRV